MATLAVGLHTRDAREGVALLLTVPAAACRSAQARHCRNEVHAALCELGIAPGEPARSDAAAPDTSMQLPWAQRVPLLSRLPRGVLSDIPPWSAALLSRYVDRPLYNGEVLRVLAAAGDAAPLRAPRWPPARDTTPATDASVQRAALHALHARVRFAAHLQTYQRLAVLRSLYTQHVYICDCTGSGKTYTAIATALFWRPSVVFVIAPPATASSWCSHWRALAPGARVLCARNESYMRTFHAGGRMDALGLRLRPTTLVGEPNRYYVRARHAWENNTVQHRVQRPALTVLVFSTRMFHETLPVYTDAARALPTALIVDEAHQMNGRDTICTRALAAAQAVVRACVTVLLSAHPIHHNNANAEGALRMLLPHVRAERLTAHYAGHISRPRGQDAAFNSVVMLPTALNTEEIKFMLALLMVRQQSSAQAAVLPQKTITISYSAGAGLAADEHTQRLHTGVTLATTLLSTGTRVTGELHSWERDAGAAKYNVCHDDLHIPRVDKVVLFVNSRRLAVELRGALTQLSITAEVLNSDTSSDADAILERFRTRLQVLICGLRSGGVGLNIPYARVACVLELGPNPSINEQVEGRLQRHVPLPAQPTPCYIIYALTQNDFAKLRRVWKRASGITYLLPTTSKV